ncbi:CU044_5270 family protein [Streptomyces aureus]|uniref:CU044_5270 family protein n=1 Tax=Streptomyces aureus TaxID=193461 RepID=UPI0034117359
MNAKTPHHDGSATAESAERADAACLLPSPAARDLPDARMRVLKEHLMSEIHRFVPAARPDTFAAAGPATPATAGPAISATAGPANSAAAGPATAAPAGSGISATTAPASAAPPKRRLRRWVPLVAPLAAAAVAAAVLTTGADHTARPADATRPARSKASLLLENAAAVVSRAPAVTVGHDQYVYVRSVSAGRDNPLRGQRTDKHGTVHKEYSKTPEKLSKSETLREWIPWSRSQGVTQAYGDRAPELVELPGPGGGTVGGPGHTLSAYEDLVTLPRDPAEALRAIETDLNKQMENGENTEGDKHGSAHPSSNAPWVFSYLGGMLQESVDPRTTAFLYRVAARIPGTTVVPDAVDAVGRHGVAITLDGGAQDRQEWIFDKSTYAFLGFRDVTKEDTVIGKAGSVLQTTAVLQRAVVNHVGDEPRKERG